MRFHYPLAASLIALAAAPALAAALPATETRLGSLSGNIVGGSLIVSPDGRRLAYAIGEAALGETHHDAAPTRIGPGASDSLAVPVTPGGGQVRMIVDGQSSAPFLSLTPAVFSPDGKHVAYAGQRPKPSPPVAGVPYEGWQVFVDGKVVDSGGDEAPAVSAAFSDDGAHVATLLRKDYQWHVTVDGTAWPPIIGTSAGLLSFSPDGKHAAVVARLKSGTWAMVIDGTTVPPPGLSPGLPAPLVDRLAGYSWKPDSSGVAYEGGFAHKRWQVFDSTTGAASAEVDGLMKGVPLFSPDASKLAFAAESRGKWQVILGDGAGPLLDQIRPDSLAFTLTAAGDPQLVYLGQTGKAVRLYVDQKPSPLLPFDGITNGTFTLSADHQHYAFAGVRGSKAIVVRDGVELPPLAEVGGGTFAFSADGTHLAFAARDAAGPTPWHFYMDGKPGSAAFAGLSPTPPAFSPEGSILAFAALTAPKQWRLIVGINNDAQSKPYEGLLAGSHPWWKEGKVGIIALAKNAPVRVEAPAPAVH